MNWKLNFLKSWTAKILLVGIMLAFGFSCEKEDLDQEVKTAFSDTSIEPTIEFTGNDLRYVAVREAGPDAPTIVFVHGAPGSGDAFYDYLKDPELATAFNMITVDRLGYGASKPGNAEPSIKAQALSIMPIIDQIRLDGQPIILVGHSYGGPIIAELGMLHPDEIDGLLFLAPAIDPNCEKYVWAGKLGCSWPTKWVTPEGMEVAAVEKSNHEKELELMENDWSLIQSKVIYVHGTSDGIVPYENYDFAKKKLAHTDLNLVTIDGGNHFIPFQKQELVKRFLFDLKE